MKKIALALFALLLANPALAADNAVIVTPGVGVPMKSKDVGAGVQAMQPVLSDTGGNPLSMPTAGADGASNTLTGLLGYNRNLVFNGTTWDRWSGDTTSGAWVNVKSSVLPTGAATSANQTGGGQKSQQVDASGNVQPSGDVVARAIFEKVTDGTNTAAVKAASTAPAATDPALVATISPNGNTVANANSGDIIVSPSSSFTRPANTTAYVAGQLVANSTTAGSVTPLSWTAARISAGNFYVRRIRMTLSSKSVANTSFILHLYSASPTIANGDGAAWLTTLANLVCDIPVTVSDVGSDVSIGFGVPAVGSECNVALASGQTMFGLLSASAAYTPASAETVTVLTEIHQN